MTMRSSARLPAAIAFFVSAATVAGLDLWTKKAIFELLKVENEGDPPRVAYQERYVVIPEFFELEANYNYGAFSGWLSEHTGWLALVSAVALVVILGVFLNLMRRPAGPGLLLATSLGFLWGGTLGNLYDRFYLRAVRDWIKWFYVSSDGRQHVWPNFNIADSAICTGVGLLIIFEIRNATRTKESTPPSPR
ncbi:MAG TPA: signal peptidase II [Planctomycetota bacterium]|nr:signal peptidase II [Planctomycetota bacterium]